MSCLVRDLSGEGARIIFSETVTMSRHDRSAYSAEEPDAARAGDLAPRRRDRAWLFRRRRRPPSRCPTPPSWSKRVAQLEGEIAALRKMLKRMKGERQDLDDEAAA